MNNKLREILSDKTDDEYNKYVNDYKKRNKIYFSFYINYIVGALMCLPAFTLKELFNSSISTYFMVLAGVAIVVFLFFGIFLLAGALTDISESIKNKEIFLDKDEFYKNRTSYYRNKTLSLSEINLLREDILNIKNKMSEYEFNELVFKVEKISGERIGSAYFYLVLFDRHQEILRKIRYEQKEKEILSIKSKSLNYKKGYEEKNYSHTIGCKEKLMTRYK